MEDFALALIKQFLVGNQSFQKQRRYWNTYPSMREHSFSHPALPGVQQVFLHGRNLNPFIEPENDDYQRRMSGTRVMIPPRRCPLVQHYLDSGGLYRA